MPKISYILDDQNIETVEVANGLSVMEGAVQNDIPGISFWTAPSITLNPLATSMVWDFPLNSM